MRLLFITQKLHGQDSFGVLWVREFVRQGYEVTVLCLEKGNEEFGFPVISMGKEKGATRVKSVLNFEKTIVSLEYDRVFVHMSPVWYTLGFWWWIIRGTPVYMWYTHYKMQTGVRLFGWFGRRFFCATPQSLPQFDGSDKKIVVGHGIDMDFWAKRQNNCQDPCDLLMVHRLSRSKRVEIVLQVLKSLPEKYRLEIYGIEAEPDYVRDLKSLVQKLNLNSRVTFHGTIPMKQLSEIYTRHSLIMNMASETIDKTMLEAMTCGCYPVTTMANAKAIGLNQASENDLPETVADFVLKNSEKLPMSSEEMYRIVAEKHGLEGLIKKMGVYIRAGN